MVQVAASLALIIGANLSSIPCDGKSLSVKRERDIKEEKTKNDWINQSLLSHDDLTILSLSHWRFKTGKSKAVFHTHWQCKTKMYPIATKSCPQSSHGNFYLFHTIAQKVIKYLGYFFMTILTKKSQSVHTANQNARIGTSHSPLYTRLIFYIALLHKFVCLKRPNVNKKRTGVFRLRPIPVSNSATNR